MQKAIASGLFVVMLNLPCVGGGTNALVGLASTADTKSATNVESALREQMEQRQMVIDRALAELNKEIAKPDKDLLTIERIMKSFGDMNATQAIPILMENLNVKSSLALKPGGRIPPTEEYPALNALIRIGRPGRTAIIEGIRAFTRGDQRARLAAFALVQIDGEHAAREVLMSKKGETVGYDEALRNLLQMYPERQGSDGTHVQQGTAPP